MHNPCRVRQTSSASKVGASATPIVGGTSNRLASRIERGRPIRSETGPHTNPPSATASTTHETVRPARDGLTPKSRESSGRIACVEYIVANIPAAPSMKPARAFWSESAAFIRTGYAARVSCRVGMAHANVASGPYAAVEQKLAEDSCVVLDGGVATELQRMVPGGTR